MAFIREFIFRVVKEYDNVWVETGLESNPKQQVIGTVCTCRVRDEQSSRLRQMTVTIAPEESIESEDAKILFEECYKTCERLLKQDLVLIPDQETELKANEFRSQNIV